MSRVRGPTRRSCGGAHARGERPRELRQFAIERVDLLDVAHGGAVLQRDEPRAGDHPREMDRALRFRVDALLDLGEDNEKVQFDAVLQVATQVCSVR